MCVFSLWEQGWNGDSVKGSTAHWTMKNHSKAPNCLSWSLFYAKYLGHTTQTDVHPLRLVLPPKGELCGLPEEESYSWRHTASQWLSWGLSIWPPGLSIAFLINNGIEMKILIKAVVFRPRQYVDKVSSELATLCWAPIPLLCLEMGGLYNWCSWVRLPEEPQSFLSKNSISKTSVRFMLPEWERLIPFILLTDLWG